MCEKDQRPAVNEKLAASLILLRVALLLGLSTERGVFMSGGGGGLETAESSVLPGCSGGSDVASAATSGSSCTEITHKHRLSLHLMKGKKGANKRVMHSLKCVFVLLCFA